MVSGEPSKATLAVLPDTRGEAAGILGDDPPIEDEGALRRGYGAIDMRYQSCVTQDGENTLYGKDCSSGFTIYGPYVGVPAKSEVEVSFEIHATTAIEVYADIVSRMASQTLAGLNRQTLAAGERRTMGYRVYVFNGDENVESRIGFAGAAGIEFRINDLTMTVR